MADTIEKDVTRGGQFLVKETKCEDIFTPEDFSEEQLMMKQTVKEFVDKEIWPNKNRFENKDYAFTEECMRKAGELGLLGVAVPEEYGGLGMGFVSTMLVCDYISGATGSFSTAFGAHTGIGTMPITLYGTEEQKKKYVPKLASGEWFGAYCLTEPGAGSDANSGKTKAVLSDDGTHYKITGQKMWISNAGFCSLFIVFARIGDDKNITGFIVENDPSNGISMNEEEHKLGIRASSTRQVFFNETKVPVENMLSERGNGFKIAMNALNVGRIKLGAACLDAQRRVTSGAIKYANERIQFNTPISNFGAIRSKIAEMATSCYAGESASYRAAKSIEDRINARVAEGSSHQEAELKGVEEFAIECSILKVAISEDIQNCSDEGIQILGGMGFSEDTPMESAWRDARIARIYEGTNEINRMLSVGMLVKKAMKGHVDLLGPAMKVAEELMGIPDFNTPDYSELFAEEKELIGKLKKAFLMVAGSAVQKYGPDLDAHQQLLMAAADILIEIYMAESTILRTEKLAKSKGAENVKEQIAMAQLYLYKAVDIINTKGKEGIASFAEGDEQRMMMMGLKRFTKYTNLPNVVALRETIASKLIQENQYCF
ncbi:MULTISPECIES: acyl-CoA dehydrogenase family protein [Flavobacterium]|jgi:alkylation response protein AidB-like acyl-CoA dehydrogenase|uniref:Alkylation response protein AidB-like acyl-CoA dehydrogenase n=1 Tax=Flavobacterium lindanitolerans TaxID=428988 RepID=A0A497TZA5_9FLAO|nr:MULTISPECIES: acyl-CoA dehydrogenase family protein [Flavobacterium]MBL7868616.1 acyl-CoA dehydrogenase family protein [Flavobacterium lindanitolerans]OJX54064.1 MAG: acyl-CoA dehydrogenase [Flavobacterium sp. 38-13]PKW30191.1 alkylation response protein AidB-like acyl-CoA dehydrogenase [Flavobacterium lindanitolerans]RLJ24531.1 alkylation response protein AidB-like acyl-CoA dehydrogenase [Flavobacterium lindanitolerans]